MTFVIVIKNEDRALIEVQDIIKGLPTFDDSLVVGSCMLFGVERDGIITKAWDAEFGILAYEFRMDEDEFLYLRKQIEETVLSGSVSYFQRDVFGNLHQLA